VLTDDPLKIVLVLDAHVCGLTHDHVKMLKASVWSQFYQVNSSLSGVFLQKMS
jgi:hypothetical protein